MKTFSIIAAASLVAAASSAFAVSGEATYEYPQPVVSAKSRAEVKAELAEARVAGVIVSGEASGVRSVTVAAAKADTAAPRVVAAADERLPLNAEALTFDGRAPRAQVPATAPILARAAR